ncbi:hypothetical protein BT63DRAFT_12530 [Microthyrium microscopicum]|uniref:Uncharacterized protein n=1 Tax=Microthyrium microscopicum TaxID=703497 RepID=A0A6A6UTY8_9PEZI|nr:hypothetical protein BT63DRAFT_12530 [Microthyrium microscopicum]
MSNRPLLSTFLVSSQSAMQANQSPDQCPLLIQSSAMRGVFFKNQHVLMVTLKGDEKSTIQQPRLSKASHASSSLAWI